MADIRGLARIFDRAEEITLTVKLDGLSATVKLQPLEVRMVSLALWGALVEERLNETLPDTGK